MAKLRVGKRTADGTYWVVVLQVLGREWKIGIGNVSDKKRGLYLSILEKLETAILEGGPPSGETRKQLQRLPERIWNRLQEKGLLEKKSPSKTLAQVVEEFLSHRATANDPRTIRNYRSTLENGLLRFCPATKPIDSIDEEDLMLFVRGCMEAGEADSTIENRIKRAKGVFAYAVVKHYATRNPFKEDSLKDLCDRFHNRLADERVQKQVETLSRLSLDMLEKGMQQEALTGSIEDREWLVVYLLTRFQCQRIASSNVLRWSDIDFEKKRIRFKTKKTGKRSRWRKGEKRIRIVPLFPELMHVLLELREFTAPGAEFVFNKIGGLESKPEFEETDSEGRRIREGRWETNLGTEFKRRIERHGITPWPQIFHAFRAYRIAELEAQGATQSEINQWFGNTQMVRDRHYSQFHMLEAERFTEKRPQKLFVLANRTEG